MNRNPMEFSLKVMKKVTCSLLVFCAATAVSAQTEVTKIAPKVIFKKLLDTPSIKNQQITMVVVTFAPSEVSKAHVHPVETIGYVLEGEIESTFNGEVHKYVQGDVFYEDPNLVHNQTKNLSAVKQAKLLVYFIGDNGKPFLQPVH